MSQMKPYCFKCGAELDPEAIYCPECGRLQRSMVVRASEPGAPAPPPPPPPGPAREEPYHFYPDREAVPAPQAEPPADHSYSYPDAPPQQPDQHDPYAYEQYPEQGWHGEDQTHAHEQDAWAAQTGDQVYAQQHPYQEEQPQQYGDQSWSDQGQQQSWHHDGATYAQPESHEHGYPQEQPGYDHDTQAYEPEQAPAWDHQAAEPEAAAPEQPSAWPYDHFDETSYRQPGSPPTEPEPWNQQEAEPYTPPPPVYRQPPPPPPLPPVVPPAPPSPPPYQPYQPYQPAEPVYSSSAPLPRSTGGDYEPYRANTPGAKYGGDRPPPSSPYAMTTYQPDASYGPDPAPSRLRVIALVAAAALGLFLVSFAVGHLLGVGAGPSAPSAAAPQQTVPPTAAPTTRPTASPASTPAPTPTADQGTITGTAKFQRMSSSIPGRCSTSQGCPVEVVLRNNGGSGSGTVTVTLTDDAGNPVGTFTGPIPTTDAGATVTVDGFATGDQLGNYLKGGGIVHITGLDIKDGGG